ncbi:glycoside hydrolase family 5 [Fusarium sp. NRRL 25303]|nr:glycoside hydrolase family 5 [Fusarium sp. NRRL 25303]
MGKTWAWSSKYISAFEAENEAYKIPQTLTFRECMIAKTIKDNLNGSSKILVTTDGGAYLGNSVLDAYFTSDNLEVLVINDASWNALKNVVFA